MKNKLLIGIIILVILISNTACSQIKEYKGNKDRSNEVKRGQLFKVEAVDEFTSLNGFKVEDGIFYFSGIQGDQWVFYGLDLNSVKLKRRYDEIGDYDVYIPLKGKDAIYVDLDGKLFYTKSGVEKAIDEKIYGSYSPNILVSRDESVILYTKGSQEESSLYLYALGEKAPKLIKDKVSSDAFFTFSYTTHWSDKSGYFIFDNNEIYNKEGEFLSKIDATASKWSPNDDKIAFIRKPEDLKQNQIVIGDWQSYIGYEFAIFNIEQDKDETIYKNEEGLLDAIDNIQWGSDGKLVGISTGSIEKGSNSELERVNYEKIFVWNVDDAKGKEIENMPYNFYEILFDRYVYGSSIGKRDRVEIVEVWGENRKIFSKPVILNSEDMFVTTDENKAYLLDGKDLVQFNVNGTSSILVQLPWTVSEMYFDKKTEQLILINEQLEMFLLKP